MRGAIPPPPSAQSPCASFGTCHSIHSTSVGSSMNFHVAPGRSKLSQIRFTSRRIVWWILCRFFLVWLTP